MRRFKTIASMQTGLLPVSVTVTLDVPNRARPKAAPSSLSLLGVALLAWYAVGCAPRQSGSDQYPDANQAVTALKDAQWVGMPAAVDAIVAEYLARPGAPPGVAVGIMQDDAVRYLKGYGLADREGNRPFTHATPSVVGSVSKTWTALAVLRLVELGLVGLDDPISQYLPVPIAWSNFTVRQLLSHTSGLRRDPQFTVALNTSEALSTYLFPWVQPPHTQLGIFPSLVLYSYAGTSVDGFQPGTSARYSNTAYMVLGALIERVAGANTAQFGVAHSTYEAFVWRYVGYFKGSLSDPNQMITPGLNTPWRQDDIPQLAKGYTWNGTAYDHTTYSSLAIGPGGWEGPAGAWTLTIGDLVRLMVALQNNSVISAATREEMMMTHGSDGSNNWGLGVNLIQKSGLPVYMHDGAYPGYRARYSVWETRGLGVALMANESTADMRNLTDAIAAVFLGTGINSHGLHPASTDEHDDPGLNPEVVSDGAALPTPNETLRHAWWEDLDRLERQQSQARSHERWVERRFHEGECADLTEQVLQIYGVELAVLLAECQDRAASQAEFLACATELLAHIEVEGVLACAVSAFSQDLRSGLISYWPFEEAGNDTPDWVSDNDLNAVGLPQVGPGRRGNALELDGAEQYLWIDHDPDPALTGLPIFGAESYTIAMWVKGSPQTARYLFSQGSSASMQPLLILQTGQLAADQAKLDVIIRNDAGGTPVNHRVSTAVVFDDTWRHVTWVDDRGQARLYIDGELDATDFGYTRSGSFTFDRTAVGTLVRAAVAEAALFQGMIDELAIWERALTQAEVREIMLQGLPEPAGVAPTIVADPVHVIAAVGATARFDVAAIGPRPLNYQWSRDGQPIAGATDATLQLENLTLDDAETTISVVVSNPHGLTVSRTARLIMPQANPPTVFFGEDVSPHPVGGINQIPRPAELPESAAAAALFGAQLPGLITETFESFAAGSSPTMLDFAGTVATLSGTREILVIEDPATTFNGVFPVSGSRVLLLPGGQAGLCVLQFDLPQTAFGFFGTDLGERAGMKVVLVTPEGWRTDIEVPITQPQGSGGAFYFGVIDLRHPFVRVELERVGDQADGFGLDDFSIAAAALGGALRLDVRRVSSDEIELSWPSETNRSYTLERRTSLSGGVWTPFVTLLGNGATRSVSESLPSASSTRFYRLVSP